jgi:hypothetical protein
MNLYGMMIYLTTEASASICPRLVVKNADIVMFIKPHFEQVPGPINHASASQSKLLNLW